MVQIRDEAKRGIEYYMQLPYSILLHQLEDEGKLYWIAEVPELPGCTSHGLTVEDAVNSLEEAKKDWILDSLDKGEEVPVPIERDRFSGKTILRMSRSLHRSLSAMAEAEKLSLNQLMVTILAKEVGRFGMLTSYEKKIDSLLDKLNDALEEKTSLFSRLPFVRALIQHEAGQYQVVGTSPHNESLALVDACALLQQHGPVSTGSPFNEPWLLHFSQPSGRKRTVFSGEKTREEKDSVEI